MKCFCDISQIMCTHIHYIAVVFSMGWGKGKPTPTWPTYIMTLMNMTKDASCMVFCWGISSYFCCEHSSFCNHVAVTNCSLQWRLAADVLKQLVLMLCWFKLYFHLPLKPFGCPSCARLHSSPHHGTAVLAFIFLFFIWFTSWNIRALLHCQFLNSVQNYHYQFWYWCYLIMGGNESCPAAVNVSNSCL